MKTLSLFPLKESDYSKIDKRVQPYLKNWGAIQTYKGKTVKIPGTWDSTVTPVKYFQVIKGDNDPNPGEEENEIGLRIELGWFPFDTEVIIEVRISGYDVLDGANIVHAEIYKAGSAKMQLYHGGKLITNFKKWGFYPVRFSYIKLLHSLQ